MTEAAIAFDPTPRREVWHNVRGEAFQVVGWSPAGATTLVLVHHGLGEHVGRYDTLARRLVPAGFAVWGYDARGHGRSDGRRGDAEGLAHLAEDLDVLLPVLLERSGCQRVALFGHSMGAAVVLWYLVGRAPHPAIDRVLLSAPPVAVERTPAVRVKLAAARLLRRVAPELTLPSGLPPEGISTVPAEVARYREDPLVHDRISAQLGWSLLTDAPRLADRAAAVSLPVLLWHGADDPIALVDGSRRLARALPTVTYHELAGARHEAHHERPEVAERVFAEVLAFLAR